MKKFIIFAAIACLFTACYTDEDQKRLQEDCAALQHQKEYLNGQVGHLEGQVATLNQKVSELNSERRALQGGREPRYIVKFKIKQGTFTLDIFEHIKNEMNSIEIEVPVCREYYNRLSIGQDMTDAFKWGSLVMDGDFSTLHMRVVGKRIE
jgi:hypothetical protein